MFLATAKWWQHFRTQWSNVCDREQDFSRSNKISTPNKIFDMFRSIGRFMNLSQAIASVRELSDLPEPRRAQIVRDLMTAPTTGRWARIAESARQEAVQARLSTRADITAAWRARATMEALRGSERPAESLDRVPRLPVTVETPRPVTVTWTTPRKPDVVRVQARPEAINSAPTYTCPPDHAHGLACYAHRCRCIRCREAKAESQRAYLERRRARESE